MEPFIQAALHDFSYPLLFAITVVYFLVLYFGLGSLFLVLCRGLEKAGLVHKIRSEPLGQGQIRREIKYSLSSILVFGFSVLPIIYLVRQGALQLLPNTAWNILLGLLILTLWNEIHFYLVHRLMHQPFFMKKVHYVHHRSHIPTVFSVFSFHWFEAVLLSTIPLTIVPFLPFAIGAVFLFPIISILLNFAGHCNYRFGTGRGRAWTLFGTSHNEHHSRGKKNFGFALYLLDKFFSKHNP